MGWERLGTKLIDNYDWQLFDHSFVYGQGSDVGLFRISQSWVGNLRPNGKLLFGSWFEAEGLWTLKRSRWPSGDAELIDSPVPYSYQAAGLTLRQIGVKPSLYSRWFPDGNWTVTIDYFQPDESAVTPSSEAEVLDDLVDAQEELTETLGDIQESLDSLGES